MLRRDAVLKTRKYTERRAPALLCCCGRTVQNWSSALRVFPRPLSWVQLTTSIAMCASVSLGIRSAVAEPASLGQFEGETDIGSPMNAGSAIYDAVNQEYEIAGSGVNMWAARDEFHFLWKRLKGDFILRTRIEL